MPSLIGPLVQLSLFKATFPRLCTPCPKSSLSKSSSLVTSNFFFGSHAIIIYCCQLISLSAYEQKSWNHLQNSSCCVYFVQIQCDLNVERSSLIYFILLSFSSLILLSFFLSLILLMNCFCTYTYIS